MKKTLLILFELLFGITTVILLLVSLTGMQRNIEWYKELFVTGIILISIVFACMLIRRMEPWLKTNEKIIVCIFFLIWAVLLYFFSIICRGEIVHDYLSVYDSAIHYARGDEVDWRYLARWRNNFPPFLLISIIAKICFIFGGSDPFYLLLFVNVIMVIWTGWCIYRLVCKISDRVWMRIMGLLLFVGFVPCWGSTHIFYSDTFSLCFGVWGLWSLLKGEYRFKDGLLAGIIWGIGYAMKATAAIVVVATYLIILLTREYKTYRNIFISIILGGAISILGIQLIHLQFPSYKLEEYKAPITYWIALGMKGDGSYGANEAFAGMCLGAENYEERKEITAEYIIKNKEDFIKVSHLLAKARNNFASGNMGLDANNCDASNVMYQFFNAYGQYGGYVIMITSGYFFALLLLGLFGCVCTTKELIREKKVSELTLITQLTVFGLVLFLMIWESNNRQLYNHIPWFVMLGLSGCYHFAACVQTFFSSHSNSHTSSETPQQPS